MCVSKKWGKNMFIIKVIKNRLLTIIAIAFMILTTASIIHPSVAAAQNTGSCIRNGRTGELRCIGDLVRITSNSYGAYGSEGRINDIRFDNRNRTVVMIRYWGFDRREYVNSFFPQETQLISSGNPGYPQTPIRVGDQVRITSHSYGAYGIVGVVVDRRFDHRGVETFMVRYLGNDGRSYVMSFYANELSLLNGGMPQPDRLQVGDTVRIVSHSYGAYGIIGRINVIQVDRSGYEYFHVQYRGNDGRIYTNQFQRSELVRHF